MSRLVRRRRGPETDNNAALRPSPTEEALDAPMEEVEDDFDVSEVEALNDPDITHLGDAPRVGGRSRASDLFGEEADHAAGRATSPKLYAQAAQFPTCTQLRVWKWENGIPVGLGTIDSTATEEDFVRQFTSAMPRKGEGRAQFKLRPIDIRGQELGQEITMVISEHHAALRAVREAEAEERSPFAGFPQQQTDMNGEMSRMVEHMLATAEGRSRALEEALEQERDRMRDEELRRTQERVDLATNAAQGVQAITERMMRDEQQRADRAARMQQEQSQLLITTLTSIFSQQQSMQAASSEASRRADEYRLEQERQRAERERRELEERRRLELQEWEFRRNREREEADAKIRLEREEAERRISREREELERKERREREEAERRDKWFAEERARREERESREARERDSERERQHQRMIKELEVQAQRDREHVERMASLSQAQNNSDVLGNAAKMLSQFGIAPNEILPRLFGVGKDDEDENKPSPWVEALPKIMGVVSDVARASMQAKAQAGPMPRPMPQTPPMLPPPYGGMPMPNPEQPRRQPVPRQQAAPPPPPAQASEAPVQEQAAEPIITPPPPPAPPPPNLSELAASKGVGLKAQKTARAGLRVLVKQLTGSPEEKWEELISVAIGNELAIYHYANAVGVKAAMLENGASPEMTVKVINGMRLSTLITSLAPDLNYGDDL